MGQFADGKGPAAESQDPPAGIPEPAAGVPNPASESDGTDIKRMTPRQRHIYLRGHYRWNVIRCQPPYNETPIAFPEDLLWIARQRGWRVLKASRAGGSLARVKRAITSRWRREPVRGDPPNLSGAVFKEVDLSGFDLSGANLNGATFTSGCNLSGTLLANADLRGATFDDVDLTGAILLDGEQETTLRERLTASRSATMSGRVKVTTRNELLRLVSNKVSLSQCDLRGADIYERDLAGLDLDPDCVVAPTAAQLAREVEDNLAQGDSPFARITLTSWWDLLWLKLAAQAGTLSFPLTTDQLRDLRRGRLVDGDFVGADFFRANLNGADLSGARLDAADLSNARLRGAKLADASLCRADLLRAVLVDATLFGTQLDGANLLQARLQRARFDDASLRSANMSVADLHGTVFRNANLECVDLRGAQVNAATSLIDVKVNCGTQLGDVVFDGTPLLEINWRAANRLGDESNLYPWALRKRSDERGRHYRDVMRAYRQMYGKLTEQGYYGAAKRYRLREKALMRQQLWEWRRYHDWLNSYVVYLLFGYGEQPGKLLAPYAATLALWAALYYALANRLVRWLPLMPAYRPDHLT